MTGHQERERLWKLWTPYDIETLKKMWREKNSASVIAAALSTGERKFTRNAVIGKINRLGLQGQGQLAPKFVKSKKRKPRAQKPTAFNKIVEGLGEAIAIVRGDAAPTRFTPPCVEVVSLDLEFPSSIEPGGDVDLPVSGRVTLFDLGSGVCRFPIGDPLAADFTFCGDACGVTRPYCETHHRLSYTPITKQRQFAWRARR